MFAQSVSTASNRKNTLNKFSSSLFGSSLKRKRSLEDEQQEKEKETTRGAVLNEKEKEKEVEKEKEKEKEEESDFSEEDVKELEELGILVKGKSIPKTQQDPKTNSQIVQITKDPPKGEEKRKKVILDEDEEDFLEDLKD
eukprot:TRINITY_DN3689_c1_g2_i4.p1 TRINITY_DN3689_c1_g2~~TRINITY_DN3689_c1_g2_i4.p1  ORF type:complete len:155 (-),score=65.68 TRINITY_DN3689_c1_g2_i4:24-443(-)